MNYDDKEIEMRLIEILGDANKSLYQQKLMEYMKDCKDLDDLMNKLKFDVAGLDFLQELRNTTVGIDKILEARYNNLRNGDDECDIDIDTDIYKNIDKDDNCLN